MVGERQRTVGGVDAETSLPTCYRHPDRETRLGCSSCERPICVECMRTASVGQKCPECAAPEGRSRIITADQIGREKVRSAPFSYGVIGIAVALFAIQFLIPGFRQPLYQLGTQANVLVADGEWYRLLTAAFLHAPRSLLHVGFNMWALSVFGPPLEREVGSTPFAALYLSGALAGGAVFYVLSPGSTAVGASGAIFALFGAWLVMSYRDRRTIQGRANLNQLLLLLGINLAISFLPGIAWEAHVGGLVAGAAILSMWTRLRDRGGRLALTLSAASVGVLALAVVILL
jgi:membrane associated rhomboid family serine protease